MPSFILALVVAAVVAEAVPTLDELASTWESVRVCNANGNIKSCHGFDGMWKTSEACADAGCCWDGAHCFAPNDQRSPADPSVARFAANQQAPSLSNNLGMLMAVKSGDPLGISCITVPPYAGECQQRPLGEMSIIAGGEASQPLLLKDASVGQIFQWFPYQIRRAATAHHAQGQFKAAVNTIVRMPFQKSAVLLEATVQLSPGKNIVTHQSYQLKVELPSLISNYAKGVTWGWGVPRPWSSNDFITRQTKCGETGGMCLLTTDSKSSAVTAIAFPPATRPTAIDSSSVPAATWNVASVDGSASTTLQIALVIGNDTQAVLTQAAALAGAFGSHFDSAKADWQAWWDSAFIPPELRDPALSTRMPGAFGGNLPTLVTADKGLSRTYYMACVSLLLNAHYDDRTGLTLFGGVGPIFGVTAMYIWDTTLCAVLLSLLEPDFLRYFILQWAGPQLHQHYAIDYVSGAAVGPWYSFNDWQLSRAVHALAQFSDGDALYEISPGKDNGFDSIAALVEYMATYWQSLTGHQTEMEAGVGAEAGPHTQQAKQQLCYQDANSVCGNLTGTWYGSWSGQSVMFDKPVTIMESSANDFIATYPCKDGWDHGNGTITSDGTVVALDVYSKATLHAKLHGKMTVPGKIEWDNGAGWCKNGSSAECTAPAPAPPDGLADYGGAYNLLECVPSYIHKVPALNAANVWLLRQAADMTERRHGNASRALELRGLATNLSFAVRSKLYVKGRGYWACKQPDGKLVEVRHIIDFATISNAIGADLAPDMASEMVNFVQQELKTEYWLRALSLHDAAASASDRKDHGPFGSYDGWLGETLTGLVRLGRYDRALDLVQKMAKVYDRGPGGQSHQVFTIGDNQTIDIPAKAAADQQYFAISGAVVANAIITDLFGVDPGYGANATDSPLPSAIVKKPESLRGFDGSLQHVRIRGSLYRFESSSAGVHAAREEHQLLFV